MVFFWKIKFWIGSPLWKLGISRSLMGQPLGDIATLKVWNLQQTVCAGLNSNLTQGFYGKSSISEVVAVLVLKNGCFQSKITIFGDFHHISFAALCITVFNTRMRSTLRILMYLYHFKLFDLLQNSSNHFDCLAKPNHCGFDRLHWLQWIQQLRWELQRTLHCCVCFEHSWFNFGMFGWLC